jgi:hypothetical protein
MPIKLIKLIQILQIKNRKLQFHLLDIMMWDVLRHQVHFMEFLMRREMLTLMLWPMQKRWIMRQKWRRSRRFA